MPSDLDRIPLTSALNVLRQQLKKAAEQAQGLDPDDVRFRISAIELELTVVAEDSASGDGEIGWWIFKAKVCCRQGCDYPQNQANAQRW